MSASTPTKRKRVRDEDVLVDFEKCCKIISFPESWVVERGTGNGEDTWLILADAKVLTTQNAKERCSILNRRNPNKVLCGLRMSTRGSRDLDICKPNPIAFSFPLTGLSLPHGEGSLLSRVHHLLFHCHLYSSFIIHVIIFFNLSLIKVHLKMADWIWVFVTTKKVKWHFCMIC